MLPVFRSTCGNNIHYADTLICNRVYYIVMPKWHMQIYRESASCQLLNYLMNRRNDAHTTIHTYMYMQRLYSVVARLPIGCAIFAQFDLKCQLTHGLQSLEELNDLPPFSPAEEVIIHHHQIVVSSAEEEVIYHHHQNNSFFLFLQCFNFIFDLASNTFISKFQSISQYNFLNTNLYEKVQISCTRFFRQ